ncbi:Synaptic vesicle 2-related protein [Auxenochlorella protothecoides]|uniref:Synaptic vesicle 2-related protein n=1 Tax=Auxenochlorella protothecoides TaxID=3075 RepID=A0A087SKT1_AUXPR|nr:Synaptic vesicle 2-related protein [Auxenochlorella protothecoides]KFM26335.1 Synaptic vesicle 2-related protein [Auxenochlorella protothecoides]
MDVTASIDSIGFGRFQWLLLAYTGLAWLADACETMLLSFLGLAVKCDWGLTSSQAAALTSVVFAGMMAGVYTLGALADQLGRRRGFLTSALLLGVAGLASAFSPNYSVLLGLRCVVGFALGGTPIAVTLFAEFLPSRGRGGWLLALQAWWTLGTVVMACIAWRTVSTPGLGWRWMLGLGSAPLFLLLALYPALPESPHWLASRGEEAAARAVLLRVARTNGRGAGGWGLGAALARVAASLRALYSPEFRRTTLLLDGIWFTNAITYYGLVLLSTELQTAHKEEQCTPDGQPNLVGRDFLNIVITSAAEAPGLLAIAFLVDGRGRKWSLRAGLLLTGLSILLLLAAGPGGGAQLFMLFLSRAGIMGAYSVLYIYTPEIYPTKLRSFGLALCNAMSRVGGFAAPYATVSLVESGRQTAALCLLGGMCLLACAAAFFLEHETRGRDLQAVRLSGPEAEDEALDGTPVGASPAMSAELVHTPRPPSGAQAS